MSSGRGMGYSVWLMPGGQTRAALARLISRLGTRYGTIRFPPHVTLLGGIPRDSPDAIEATHRLARSIGPFDLRIDAARSGDDYFRCVFLKADASTPLLAAHHRSREAFGVRPARPFFPHLSLIYGRLDGEEKRELLREIRIQPFVFRVSRVHLWLTHGPVPAWLRVTSARLTSSSARFLS